MTKRKTIDERIDSIVLQDDDGETIEVTPKEMFRMFKFLREAMERLGVE